jgi:hypothetical protein
MMATQPKYTAADVADWMLGELSRQKYLYQETAVYDIEKRFGKTFVYENASGNLAIGKDVLRSFNKLTSDTVIWERGEKLWRKREKYDQPGRLQD